MKSLDHWLRIVVERLKEIDARFALVGGMAVGVRTEPRFTKDIDIAVAVSDDAEAERVAGHFIRRGFVLVQEFDQSDTGRFVTGRFAPPDAGIISEDSPVVVDLLFMTSGIEREVVAKAVIHEVVPGVIIPVARIEHLIAMKLLSVSKHRVLDTGDLQQLIMTAMPAELKRAERLAALIMKRKPESRRDLVAALRRYVKRWRRDK